MIDGRDQRLVRFQPYRESGAELGIKTLAARIATMPVAGCGHNHRAVAHALVVALLIVSKLSEHDLVGTPLRGVRGRQGLPSLPVKIMS